MRVNDWILNLRNSLMTYSGEFDSPAAIDGAMLTSEERAYYKAKLQSIVKKLDTEFKKEWKRKAKESKRK